MNEACSRLIEMPSWIQKHNVNVHWLICSEIYVVCFLILCKGLMVPWKIRMGMCHSFHPQSYIENENESLISTRAGKQGGLMLVLNIAQYEYRYGDMSAGVKVRYNYVGKVSRYLKSTLKTNSIFIIFYSIYFDWRSVLTRSQVTITNMDYN